MAEQRRELPEFERGRIIGAHDAGMSIREIAELYGVSKSTVHRVIKDFEEEGLTEPRPRSGRLPKIKGAILCEMLTRTTMLPCGGIRGDLLGNHFYVDDEASPA